VGGSQLTVMVTFPLGTALAVALASVEALEELEELLAAAEDEVLLWAAALLPELPQPAARSRVAPANAGAQVRRFMAFPFRREVTGVVQAEADAVGTGRSLGL
jgi:hypothetical protein